MYHDFRKVFLWERLKNDIEEFVTNSPNFQQLNVEHQKTCGLLQEIEVPTWKWEDINLDFMVGLARTQKQFDTIWVVVDRLTKSAHFILDKVYLFSGRLF